MPQSPSTEFDDNIAVATNRRHSPPATGPIVTREILSVFLLPLTLRRPWRRRLSVQYASISMALLPPLTARTQWWKDHVGAENTQRVTPTGLSQCERQEVMLTMMRVFSFFLCIIIITAIILVQTGTFYAILPLNANF